MAPPPQSEDAVEVEFGPQYRSGMGLRIHPATESGLGALFVFSYFATPVQVLAFPPCRYQIDAIGELNVRSTPFEEIKEYLQMIPEFPVVVRFVPNPPSFTLHFQARPLRIQISERKRMGRIEIVDYLLPFQTTDTIPSRFWGTHFIRSVNGQNLANTPAESAQLLNTLQTAPLPLVLDVDIVQTMRSLEMQQCLVHHYRSRPEVSQCQSNVSFNALASAVAPHATGLPMPRLIQRPAKRPLPSPTTPPDETNATPPEETNPAPPEPKKPSLRQPKKAREPKKARVPVAPTTIVLDDSDDDDDDAAKTMPPVAPALSTRNKRDDPLGVDKVVATPFGNGLILVSPGVVQPPIATSQAWSTATTNAVPPEVFKVQLAYGVGYFQRAALTPIDDKVQYTYYKQRSKGWVVLTYGDTARLVGQRLLNDSVIEFYLSYLMDTLPPDVVDKTYMCSSFLFGQYSVNKKQARKCGAPSIVEHAYASVARWTKAVDIFRTKYLVVPINEEGHWSVAIVCNLYRFATPSHWCRCAVDPKAATQTPPTVKQPTKPKPAAKKPAAPARMLLARRAKVPRTPPPTQPATKRSRRLATATEGSTKDESVADNANPLPPSEVDPDGSIADSDASLETPTSRCEAAPCRPKQEPSELPPHAQAANTMKRPVEPPSPVVKEEPDVAAPAPPVTCDACGLERDVDQAVNHRPCVVFLDSLKAHRTFRVSNFIREYLQMEWRARKAPTCGAMSFSAANLPAVCPPEIPRQTNYTDCGVFVLQYVELFLSSPPLISTGFVFSKGADSQNILTSQWFPHTVIRRKRVAIRGLIERLARESTAPPAASPPLKLEGSGAAPASSLPATNRAAKATP